MPGSDRIEPNMMDSFAGLEGLLDATGREASGTPDRVFPPGLPPLVKLEDGFAPKAPVQLKQLGVDPNIVSDLALKLAYTVPQFSTEWAAQRLMLSPILLGEILERQRVDQLLEVLGSSGPFGYRYAISHRGRERAARLLEVSGYIGPAPVSLETYTAMIEWQIAEAPKPSGQDVVRALRNLILSEESRTLAGLAISSGRSLFVYGPPGNGKTSLGRSIHSALGGSLWVPHCIAVESSIIRIFDTQVHEADEPQSSTSVGKLDHRWVRIKRPLVVCGGEPTLDAFDLSYSPSLRFYEAPLHMKANGGTFLIDDFGRQQVDPHEMLNRWIVPLEHQFDYLTLNTGQKIQVPFLMNLIIATNLTLSQVTDPAFLRRMGYRLHLGMPTPDEYASIFRGYAAKRELDVPDGLVEWILERYQLERRDLRGCEPRDLIERACDVSRFQEQPLRLDRETLELAWKGYFGTTPVGEG